MLLLQGRPYGFAGITDTHRCRPRSCPPIPRDARPAMNLAIWFGTTTCTSRRPTPPRRTAGLDCHAQPCFHVPPDTQIHSKGVSHPMKTFLNVIWGFSRFVQKDASPNSQRVGRISLLLVFRYVWTRSSCRGSEMERDPGPGEISHGILLQVAGHRHIIQL